MVQCVCRYLSQLGTHCTYPATLMCNRESYDQQWNIWSSEQPLSNTTLRMNTRFVEREGIHHHPVVCFRVLSLCWAFPQNPNKKQTQTIFPCCTHDITIANFPRYTKLLYQVLPSRQQHYGSVFFLNSCDGSVPKVCTQIVTPYSVFCTKRRNVELCVIGGDRPITFQILRDPSPHPRTMNTSPAPTLGSSTVFRQGTSYR